VQTLRSAAYDVFPEFVPPQASVQTEAPGLSPQQVEMLVTRPLEAVINGANGVETVRSQSIQGLSVIDITFREGNDAYRARQQVSEALAEAISRLPPGVDTPRLTPLVSSTMDLLKIGLVSQRLSPMQLRDLAEWTIKPRLLAVPGVARANVFGGEQRRIEVRADPARLLARADLCRSRPGGERGRQRQRRRLCRYAQPAHPGRSRPQRHHRRADRRRRAGHRAGRHCARGDVAQVADAPAPPVGDALIMGKPGVLLTLSSQYGANTLDTTRALERAIDDLAPALRAQG
jgi:multidrug efflux pump subunit AcrB